MGIRRQNHGQGYKGIRIEQPRGSPSPSDQTSVVSIFTNGSRGRGKSEPTTEILVSLLV